MVVSVGVGAGAGSDKTLGGLFSLCTLRVKSPFKGGIKLKCQAISTPTPNQLQLDPSGRLESANVTASRGLSTQPV